MLYKVEQVAMQIGVSVETVNRWYRTKKRNPQNELLAELPNYSLQDNGRGNKVRLWTDKDIWTLTEFLTKITKGRAGKMGKYGGRGTDAKKET